MIYRFPDQVEIPVQEFFTIDHAKSTINMQISYNNFIIVFVALNVKHDLNVRTQINTELVKTF